MKIITVPEEVRTREKRILKYENTPIALVSFDVLAFRSENKPCSKIGDFYSKLIEKQVRWTETEFAEYARDQFIADRDPRKKFRYSPIDLKTDMNVRFPDHLHMEITLSVTLSKGGRTISKKVVRHLWNLKNGKLVLRAKKARKDRRLF